MIRLNLLVPLVLALSACSSGLTLSGTPAPANKRMSALDRALHTDSIPFRTIYTGYWPKFEYPKEKEYVVFPSQEEFDAFMTKKEMADHGLGKPLDRPIDFEKEDGLLVLSWGYPQGTILEILAVDEVKDRRTVYSVTWTCDTPDPMPAKLDRDRLPVCNEEASRPYHLIAVAKADKRTTFEPLIDASSYFRPLGRPWPFPTSGESESWKTNPRGGPQ